MDYLSKKSIYKAKVVIIAKKKHTKNEVILDLAGLVPVLKKLVIELKKADKIGDLVRGEDFGPPGYTTFDRLLDMLTSLTRLINRLREAEYLIHPRPYSPKDIFRMRIDSDFSDYLPKDTAFLRRILAKTGHSVSDVKGRWLQFEKGKIVSVS